MASKKRKGMPRRPRRRRSTAACDRIIIITSCEITPEPLTELPENQLAPDLAAHVARLHHLTRSSPRDAIVELKRLIDRYPDCPKLFNFLGVAYSSIGDVARAERVVKDTYERFPDYLFGKLAYADMCVARGELDEIPVIFNGKYDLSRLCPTRKRFHITEAVAFMGVMGFYSMERGDIERARPYHKVLKSIAPDGPHTRRLDQLMRETSVQSRVARWTTPNRP
jgi:hypothetical protein